MLAGSGAAHAPCFPGEGVFSRTRPDVEQLEMNLGGGERVGQGEGARWAWAVSRGSEQTLTSPWKRYINPLLAASSRWAT